MAPVNPVTQLNEKRSSRIGPLQYYLRRDSECPWDQAGLASRMTSQPEVTFSRRLRRRCPEVGMWEERSTSWFCKRLLLGRCMAGGWPSASSKYRRTCSRSDRVRFTVPSQRTQEQRY